MPKVQRTKAKRKTERSTGENQERAFIAASRRLDRSLEARFESAQKASTCHKIRTGRGLRITREAVKNEEMYEEEEDNFHRQRMRNLETQNDKLDMQLNMHPSYFTSGHRFMGSPYYSGPSPYLSRGYENGAPSTPQWYQAPRYMNPYGEASRSVPPYAPTDSWIQPQSNTRSMSYPSVALPPNAHGANLPGMSQPIESSFPAQRSLSASSANVEVTPGATWPQTPDPYSRSISRRMFYATLPNTPHAKPKRRRADRAVQRMGYQYGSFNEEAMHNVPAAQSQIRRYSAPQVHPMEQMVSGSASAAAGTMSRPAFDTSLSNSYFYGQTVMWNPYSEWHNSFRPDTREITAQPGAMVAPHGNHINSVAPEALAHQQGGEASRCSTTGSVSSELTVQPSTFVSQPSRIDHTSGSTSIASHSESPGLRNTDVEPIAQNSADSGPLQEPTANIDTNAQSNSVEPAAETESSNNFSTEFLSEAATPLNENSQESDIGLPELVAPDLIEDSAAESALDVSADLAPELDSSEVRFRCRGSLDPITGTEVSDDIWQECFNNGFWKPDSFDNSAFMPANSADE
ncbi:predicted protein [Uncinocarpus reesii 1704]|uniref:Uncharacterized protein n=1 Tax=Uncinocarpus reesii (strain UAMH 1704) TaxID=336963 RepID=C4JK03_UNCRE|nr:uncharacterized protein UREG_01960 [Uncinocarpus reesii 1704]EEP77111.1 predicted protein [Uncinocarpus reesii 1704]